MIDQTAFIHPSAIVEEGAVIGANVHIGPFCYVGSQVEIGAGTVLKSHVVVNGITKIGCDNQIYQFASIGEVNQDLKYAGEPTRVEVGDRNRIRESVTIHRGTAQGTGLTKVGNDNLLMVNTHIGHDCVVGNFCAGQQRYARRTRGNRRSRHHRRHDGDPPILRYRCACDGRRLFRRRSGRASFRHRSGQPRDAVRRQCDWPEASRF